MLVVARDMTVAAMLAAILSSGSTRELEEVVGRGGLSRETPGRRSLYAGME